MAAIGAMVVVSIPLLALMLAIVFLNVRETHSFAVRAKSKSMSLVEMRRQSLSRTKKSTAPPRKHGINHMQTDNASLSKQYLLDVIDEALYRQMSALEALDRQNQSVKEDSRTDRIEARRGELADITTKMKDLQSSIQTRNGPLFSAFPRTS